MVPRGGEFLRQLRFPGGGPLTGRAITAQGGALAGLALALAVAAALRLPGIGTWNLWVDEVATAGFASLDWGELTGPLARLETTPPTYYLLVKAWTMVAGASDGALRLPSALAGIATVAALWLLCRDAFGRRAAFWSAMILAVAGWHLFHSRDARVYALLALVMVLALLAGRGFAARAARPGWGWVLPALGLAALGSLAAWLHFTGVIAAAMAFIHAAALMIARGTFDRRALVRLTATAAICAALILPMLALAASIAAAREASGDDWMRTLGLGFAVTSIARVLLLSPWAVDPWLLLGPIGAGLAALVWLLLAWLAARPGPRVAERVVLAATLLSGVALFLLIHPVAPVVLPRTLLVLVPLVAALLGLGLARLRPGVLRPLVFAVFVVSQGPSLHDIFRAPPDGSDWRGLAARLAAKDGPGQTVIVLDVFDAMALERYGGPPADLVLLSPADAPLQRFITARLAGVPAVGPAGLVPALCGAAAASMDGLLVVERLSPVLDEQRRLLEAALQPSGAQPGDAAWDRSLRLRPFTPPSCPVGLPAARP